MSDPIISKPSNNKKTISRREFIKLGAAATAAVASAAATGSLAQAAERAPRAAPVFLQGAKMELNFLTWFWTEPGRSDAWRAMIKKFHASQSDIHINESGYGEN